MAASPQALGFAYPCQTSIQKAGTLCGKALNVTPWLLLEPSVVPPVGLLVCRSVGTILTGLMSFMYENAQTTGSISTSRADKQRLACQSLDFNLRDPIFKKLFPEYIEQHRQRQQQQVALFRSFCLSASIWLFQGLGCN